jgi:hypothetical protein
MGGQSSSTIRNITIDKQKVFSLSGCTSDRDIKRGLRTRHGVGDIPIRWASREQLNHRAAERPNVGFCRRAIKLDDFWCHPVGGASDVFDITFHSTEIERDTKVRELHISGLGREDVRCLEIAMYHVATVEIV